MNRKEKIVIQAAWGFAKNISVGDASEIALNEWAGRVNGRQYKVHKKDASQCVAQVEFEDLDINASVQLAEELNKQKIEVQV